jgi:aldose 1-epimerase
MRLYSNQPALQFYAGNHFDGTARGKGGKWYTAGSIIALEPQMFPDTPNQPALGTIRLDPGATYHHRIAWAFDVAADIGI